MGEKRGNTVKLKYDFNTAGLMEVCIRDKWYRVTAKEFRSFDGKRRITQPKKAQGRGEIFNVDMIEENYNGPVYVYGTNIETDYQGTGQVINSPDRAKLLEISKSRNKN